MKKCSEVGCDRKHHAKGLCHIHYKKQSTTSRLQVKNSVARNVARNKEFIRLQKERPCADCSIQYPYYIMQFDHTRGIKSFILSDPGSRSIQLIQKEIDKCDVVCANCHAERTYQRKKESHDRV